MLTNDISCSWIHEEKSDEKPNEYQFWCFNGEVLFVSVIYQPHGRNLKATYDMDWRRLPFVTSEPEFKGEVERPKNFDEMKACAKKLSRSTLFLRVDFISSYCQFYFGELTKFPAGGTIQWKPQEWDEKLGELLIIPKLENK